MLIIFCSCLKGSWNWTAHSNPEGFCYVFSYACGINHIQTVSNKTFFLEHELQERKISEATLKKPSNEPAFLPDTVGIPFSSSRLPEILSRWKIEPKSTEAATIKQTLGMCEIPALKGERKYCTSSVESLIKFALFAMGGT
ncbi:hypothetical protein PIB30_039006 [Stylosanthes scabra]|uniref:BURP domain-containing protein n=1 Tax=Stylosanthes scabra TaxID=79078 RepID=A0ABU6ZCV7_9FABA|nr:hypothetical protein [Stylosanthes scabra]